MGDATYSPVPGSRSAPWFADVLEAIEQFGLASIGLVAWELFLTEEQSAARGGKRRRWG